MTNQPELKPCIDCNGTAKIDDAVRADQLFYPKKNKIDYVICYSISCKCKSSMCITVPLSKNKEEAIETLAMCWNSKWNKKYGKN